MPYEEKGIWGNQSFSKKYGRVCNLFCRQKLRENLQVPENEYRQMLENLENAFF